MGHQIHSIVGQQLHNCVKTLIEPLSRLNLTTLGVMLKQVQHDSFGRLDSVLKEVSIGCAFIAFLVARKREDDGSLQQDPVVINRDNFRG